MVLLLISLLANKKLDTQLMKLCTLNIIMNIEQIPAVSNVEYYMGAPETPRTSQHYRIEGFKGVLNWSPTMSRGVSLSDSDCKFFSPVWILCDKFSIISNKI